MLFTIPLNIVKALKKNQTSSTWWTGNTAIQWLTVYEVINSFWKETYLLHKLSASEATSLVNVFTKLFQEMVMLEPRDLEQEILKMAISKGITVYDASYVALAVKHNLTLVTEDQKLSHKVSDIINVISLESLT